MLSVCYSCIGRGYSYSVILVRLFLFVCFLGFREYTIFFSDRLVFVLSLVLYRRKEVFFADLTVACLSDILEGPFLSSSLVSTFLLIFGLS